MSSLDQFRDHCRKMAMAQHKPECLWPDEARAMAHNRMQTRFEEMFDEPMGSRTRATFCDGCVSRSDRDLFAQMAEEIDDYLAPQVDLFGDVTFEPDVRAELRETDTEEAAS